MEQIFTPEQQAALDALAESPAGENPTGQEAIREEAAAHNSGELDTKLQEEPTGTQTPLDKFAMDELLFDNGPTRAQVEAMKKQYPNSQVLCVLFADGSGIIYRTVTRFEWRNIQQLIAKVSEPDQKDDIIFSKIVLWPDLSDRTKVNDMPAGAVMTVMNEFYVYSGFTPAAESMRL